MAARQALLACAQAEIDPKQALKQINWGGPGKADCASLAPSPNIRPPEDRSGPKARKALRWSIPLKIIAGRT